MVTGANPNEITLDDKIRRFKYFYRTEIHWLKSRIDKKELPKLEEGFKKIIKKYPWLSKHDDCWGCFGEAKVEKCYICDLFFYPNRIGVKSNQEIIRKIENVIEDLDPDYSLCDDLNSEVDSDFWTKPESGERPYYQQLWMDGVRKKKLLSIINKFRYAAIKKDKVNKRLLKSIPPKGEIGDYYIFGTLDFSGVLECDLQLFWYKERVNKEELKQKVNEELSRKKWLVRDEDWECLDTIEPSTYSCGIYVYWEGATYRDVVSLIDVLDEIVDKLDPDYVVYTNWEGGYSGPFPEKISDEHTLEGFATLYTAIRKDRIDEKLKKSLKKTKKGFIIPISPISSMLFEERKNHYVYISKSLLEFRKKGKMKYYLCPDIPI